MLQQYVELKGQSAIDELEQRRTKLRAAATHHRDMAEEFAKSSVAENELAEEAERLADEYTHIIAALK